MVTGDNHEAWRRACSTPNTTSIRIPIEGNPIGTMEHLTHPDVLRLGRGAAVTLPVRQLGDGCVECHTIHHAVEVGDELPLLSN